VYRLPREAEWEYACRGGLSSKKIDYAFSFYFEKPTNQLLPDQANCINKVLSRRRTCKVGSYKPNRLGLYDMHGNVWEWCDDSEKAPDRASHRVTRGGGWTNDSWDCRAASRNGAEPSLRHFNAGLRLARVPVGKEGK
jgi:formylglycine-generating enzyme required for sulfatase activity